MQGLGEQKQWEQVQIKSEAKLLRKYDHKNTFILHFKTGMDNEKSISGRAFYNSTTLIEMNKI